MVLRCGMIVAIRRGPLGARDGARTGWVYAVSLAGRGEDVRPAPAALSHDWHRRGRGGRGEVRPGKNDQTNSHGKPGFRLCHSCKLPIDLCRAAAAIIKTRRTAVPLMVRASMQVGN